MTTETEMDIAPEQGKATLNIGEILREKRLSLAYPERQVATELKLSIEKVYALESNQFDRFRSATFARGYLKSYCRVLGIDHHPIIAAFDEQQLVKETNIRSVDNVKQQATVRDPIVVIISLIVIAIVVFVAFWWPSTSNKDEVASVAEPTSQEQTLSPATESNTAEPEAQPVDVSEAASENIDELDLSALDNVDVAALQESLIEGETDDVVTGLSAETKALLEDAGLDPNQVEEATRNNAELASENIVQESSEPAYTHDIVVRFSNDCWTQVRDNTGRTLFSGVKSAGSRLELNGEAPYRVTLGYARGVTELVYKGEPFDFSSHIRKDLARFELE